VEAAAAGVEDHVVQVLGQLRAVEAEGPQGVRQHGDLLALQVGGDAHDPAARDAVGDLPEAGTRIRGKAAVQLHFELGRLRRDGMQVAAVDEREGILAAAFL
jgi:hypothetical protein